MKRNTSGAVRAMETEEEEKLIGAIRRERRSRVFCIDTPRWTEGERDRIAQGLKKKQTIDGVFKKCLLLHPPSPVPND